MQGHFKSCLFLLFTVLTLLSAQSDDENGWPSFEFMKIGRIRPPPVDSGRGIDRMSFGSEDRAIPPPWLLPPQTHQKEEMVAPPAAQVRSFFDDESGPGLLPVAPWTQSPPRPAARNVDEDRPPRPTSRVQQQQQQSSVTSVKELPSSSIHINSGSQQKHPVKPAAPVVRPHYASDDEGTPSISHVNQYPDEEGDDIPAYYRPTPTPRASESDFFRNHPEHRSVDDEEYQSSPRMFDPDRPIFRSGQTPAPHYLRDHYNDRYSTEEEQNYQERQRPQQRARQPSYDPYREDEYEQRQPPPQSNRRNPRPRPEESRQEEREISGHSFDQSDRPLSKRPLPLNDELLPGQRDRPVLKQTNKLPPEELEQNEQQRPQQQSSDSNNNDGPQLYLRPPGGGGRRPITESKEPEVNKDFESQSSGQENKDEEQQQRPSGGGRRPPNNSRPPVDDFNNNNNNDPDQFNHGHGNHHDHGGNHHDHGGHHNFPPNDDFRQDQPQFNGPPPRRPPPRRPPPQRPPPQRESVVTQGLNILKSVVGIQSNPPPRRPQQFRPEQRRPGPGGPHRRPPPREPIELSIDIGRQDYRMVEDDEPFFDEDTSSTQITDSEDPVESLPSSAEIEGRSIKLRPSSLKATNKLPANVEEEPTMEHRGFPKTSSDSLNSAELYDPSAYFSTTLPETTTLAYIPTTTASTTTTTVETTSSTLFPPFSKRVRPTHFSKIQDDAGQSRIMSYKQRIEAMKEKAKQREQQLKPTTLSNEPDQSTEASVTQTVSISSSSSTTARPSTTRPRIPPRMPVRKPSPTYTTTTTESNPFADEEEKVENKPTGKLRFQKTTTAQPPSEKEEFTKPAPVNPFERRRAQQQQDTKFLKDASFSKINKLRQSSRLTSTTSVQPDDFQEETVTEEAPKIELVSIIDGQQFLEERSDSNLEVDQDDDLASSLSSHHHQPEMLSESIRPPSTLNFASHDPILPIEELLNIRVRDNGKGM